MPTRTETESKKERERGIESVWEREGTCLHRAVQARGSETGPGTQVHEERSHDAATATASAAASATASATASAEHGNSCSMLSSWPGLPCCSGMYSRQPSSASFAFPLLPLSPCNNIIICSHPHKHTHTHQDVSAAIEISFLKTDKIAY